MRTRLWLLCLLFCHAASAKYTDSLQYKLREAAQENNFFKVKALLKEADGKIAPPELLFYSALSENKFDQCIASNEHIAYLLSQYKIALSDSTILDLLDTRVSNDLRLYRYRSVANTCSEIIARFGKQLDTTRLKSYENTRDLFATLSDVPPQKMNMEKDDTIWAHRNAFNHLMVPVKAGGLSSEFIFDSGAGLSTISESYAKKMKMKIYESSITVKSATTIDVKSKLAVAETFFVGDIQFKNVVFLVLPDEKLSFPQVNLVINGIVGFPVMYQMGEIHMYKDGMITVPQVPKNEGLHNLCLDNLVPVVAVRSGKDTLLFNMDTGAKTTELSKRYYDKHKAQVEALGTKTTKHFGGAGGIAKSEVYELPDFNFIIGSKDVHLANVAIMLSDHGFTKNRDGNLGQDVITMFDEMVLNFKYMYVDFETAK